MTYRGPGIPEVVWLGSSPFPPPPSVRSIDYTQEDWQTERQLADGRLYQRHTHYWGHIFSGQLILQNWNYSVLTEVRSCIISKLGDRLKGQCHKIFCFRFFSWITFPQAPENNIKVISNFFKNSLANQGAPPVSMTPVANFDTSSAFVVDTGGKQWEQYQAADTLKWTWMQKFIYMLTVLPKGVQTKLLKFFCLKIFSICHRCCWHWWCTLSSE